SVDGDMSTNDTCVVLANGLTGNPVITEENSDYEVFSDALKEICIALARLMAKDGEGATHLLTCTVSGCASEEKAETLAKSVINSSLTKAAIFGADANWGRVLAALGYAGVPFDPKAVDVSFASAKGELPVCQNGMGVPFDEDKAKDILREEEVIIHCNMNEGTASATCWGCDLTYEYVKINGDYRT
ncbi:MAG: bifunctional ornithine acetyltransferase/N-acetylglutamate synthase, partial [Clostridia bacterium]|nr:bifunctional ornithine acetyltransferase/N-acetylglutamate synthase [Clostridia bacterium]